MTTCMYTWTIIGRGDSEKAALADAIAKMGVGHDIVDGTKRALDTLDSLRLLSSGELDDPDELFYVIDNELHYVGIVPTNPQDALELSILKWEMLAGFGSCEIEDGGTTTCGLCLYYQDSAHDRDGCAECPVAIASGSYGCVKTPYPRAHQAQGDSDQAAYMQAVKDEIAFLKSLKTEVQGEC